MIQTWHMMCRDLAITMSQLIHSSEPQEVRHVTGATLVKIGFFEVNPVTKTGKQWEGRP